VEDIEEARYLTSCCFIRMAKEAMERLKMSFQNHRILINMEAELGSSARGEEMVAVEFINFTPDIAYSTAWLTIWYKVRSDPVAVAS
jgi:hypothetical protein